MECDNFDGSICLNAESNNYGSDCDIDCEYKKEKEIKEICERLKERNIITEYGMNLSHTKFFMFLNEKINWNDDELPYPLDICVSKEFRKIGYNAFCDGYGEIWIKMK